MTDYVATPHISIITDLRNLPKGMSLNCYKSLEMKF
jgi:hypothetical protein